jgi:hypothetical protein
MLPNVENVFRETPAYFGFLEFVYSNDDDNKVKSADENANDDDKSDRLSSVSHSDLYAVVA